MLIFGLLRLVKRIDQLDAEVDAAIWVELGEQLGETRRAFVAGAVLGDLLHR